MTAPVFTWAPSHVAQWRDASGAWQREEIMVFTPHGYTRDEWQRRVEGSWAVDGTGRLVYRGQVQRAELFIAPMWR